MQATVVFQKIWEAIHAKNPDGTRKYKYIINTGSSRSSKTYSILQTHWLTAFTNPNYRISVWRETKADCKITVLADLKKAVPSFPNSDKVIFNKTESIYTFPNGATIELMGGDEENRVHGFQGNVAHLNEPYKFSLETFDQIDMRTSDYIIIDWNPKNKHWIDEVSKRDNAIVIHSTFRDNPFIPYEQKKKILSYELTPYNIEQGTANFYMWQVYGLGLKAEKPNKIYHNWREIDKHIPFEDIPYPSYYGLDFGSRNPSALVEVKFDGERSFFIRELFYIPRNELKVSLGEAIQSLIKDKRIPIICDYAEPDAINDLRTQGYNALPCTPKNVKGRIDFIQNQMVYLTKDSHNLWNEYESYEWEIVNNVNIERPLKQDDHLLDALAYCIEYIKFINKLK